MRMTVAMFPRKKPIFGHRRSAWRQTSVILLIGASLAGLVMTAMVMFGFVPNHAFIIPVAKTIVEPVNVGGLGEDRR